MFAGIDTLITLHQREESCATFFFVSSSNVQRLSFGNSVSWEMYLKNTPKKAIQNSLR